MDKDAIRQISESTGVGSDIVAGIFETAATANACFVAAVHVAQSDAAMGDRLIAAGARAAESERQLRALRRDIQEVIDEFDGYVGNANCIIADLRAALGGKP